jgi:putative aldouronate transport system substrate-binding protein
MNDQIGMVYYPGWNLAQETYDAHKKDLNSIAVWAPLDPPKASSGTGGQYAPGGTPGGVFVLSKQLEKDQGKLKRVLHWFDSVIYPNENYWAVSQGGDENIYPGMSRKSFDKATGTNVFELFRDKHPAYTDPSLNPLWNWQTIGYTLIWQVYDDPMGKIGSAWNQQVIQMPRYKNNDLFLALDAETVEKIREFGLKNEIQFVLGQRSLNDWDAYMAEWKAAGGQKLLDQAAAQLKVGK